MKKIILTDYWRCNRLVLNLGDYITELLLEKFGYEIEYYPIVKQEGRLNQFDRCFLVIGSLFENSWFNRVKMPKIIWGCGYWGDPAFSLSRLSECTIHLVRGPMTKKLLNLPETTPIGDPALLMSSFFPLKRQSSGHVIYVPHFSSRDNLPANTLKFLGATSYLDIGCTKESFFDRVKSIVDAEFVLTSSLHAAIIAQSYNRPWALVNPIGSTHDKPLKWKDWFASLEIEPQICQNFEEAEEWWFTRGIKGITPSIRSILESFPHP